MYIYREREVYVYMYSIYIYIYTHTYVAGFNLHHRGQRHRAHQGAQQCRREAREKAGHPPVVEAERRALGERRCLGFQLIL